MIPDTGRTSDDTDSNGLLTKTNNRRIRVRMPDARHVESTQGREVPFLQKISQKDAVAHRIPQFSKSLLSIEQLYNISFTAFFAKTHYEIKHNGRVVLQGEQYKEKTL